MGKSTEKVKDLVGNNKEKEARYVRALERKEVPPERSGFRFMMARQKDIPDSQYGLTVPTVPVENSKGITAEGFIIIEKPERTEIHIGPDGTISTEMRRSVIGDQVFGLPSQSDNGSGEGGESEQDQSAFTMEVLQNIKYLRGPVEVRIRGWRDEPEFKKAVIQNIDELIRQGVNSIADVVALYRLRLTAQGVQDSDTHIEIPDNIPYEIGEVFGEEYEYDYDPDSVIAVTEDGQQIPRTTGAWFSFQTPNDDENSAVDDDEKVAVYDSLFSWNGEKQPRQVAEQAVGLLLCQGKVLLNLEYCPARLAYELVAVGGGFKSGQGVEKVENRIKATITGEAREEQGAQIRSVEFLTPEDNPMLNAPNHYAQKTHLVLAEVDNLGERDLGGADEVTELGLVALSMDQLDSLIASGVIKDPSIIAARALMVAHSNTAA